MNSEYDVARWNLPTDELRAGFFSAKYFQRTKTILEQNDGEGDPHVLMQVFQKGENTVVCGVDESIAVLKIAAGRYVDPELATELIAESRRLDTQIALATSPFSAWIDETARLIERRAKITLLLHKTWKSAWGELTVRALPEGSIAQPWETVITIEGPYAAFAHLESVYLGILADRSGVATKTRRIVEAAAPRSVLFFGDRFKDFRTQTGDGWAAYVGGAAGVCTDAHAFAYDGEAGGTMPHALIAACGGSTVEAARRFVETFPDVPLVALVDYENDCVKTSLDVARALGDRLKGVRLDTSEKLVDESLRRDPPPNVPDEKLRGVNRYLCENVRRALDVEGFRHVQIIASGGMTPEKVVRLKDVVDVFGVGSSLLKGGGDFTADIVMVNGEPQSKIGRAYRPNDRLEDVKG